MPRSTSPARRWVLAAALPWSLAACNAPTAELGPGRLGETPAPEANDPGRQPPAPAPVPIEVRVAPDVAPVFSAGTSGGPIDRDLLVRVLDNAGEPRAGIIVWADAGSGRVEGRTNLEGQAILRGLDGACDVHVFGPNLYRTLLDVDAAALTVRLGDGTPEPPARFTTRMSVDGLSTVPSGPFRFAHVRAWSWPGAGALRPDLPVSEDVAIEGPGLEDDYDTVTVPVPPNPYGDGEVLTLFGGAEQARLTSWGREVGWSAVTHLARNRLANPSDEVPPPIRPDVPLSERLDVVFPEVRRHSTRLAASRWEARYELVDDDLGATRALRAGRSAAFNEPVMSLRIPAAIGGFEDVRFAVTVRAYQGDWWIAERTIEVGRGEALEVIGFPTGRPGRRRDGRVLQPVLPPDSRFGRLIFLDEDRQWWVDMLDRARAEVVLPEPPEGLADPLVRPSAPLMRAHFFDRLNPQAWNARSHDQFEYFGVSIER